MITGTTYLDVFLLVAAMLVSGLATWLFLIRKMPASHRIAVLGFPQCGKSTLITAVFAYLFRHGVRGASILPRGDETIKRINANMEQLELGKPLAPTRDQDVFAYRAEVVVKSILSERRYKLEIGDFPGENTVSFVEEHGDWLHLTRYFEWAISADAFLLAIDVGAVLQDESGEYVARQKKSFRAAWQRLQEYHLEGASDVTRKPLVLLFTKTDLLFKSIEAASINEPVSDIATPPIRMKCSVDEVKEKTAVILSRFQDLIEYFHRENKRFSIVFSSVFVDVNGERLGIPEVARYVMPESSFGLSIPHKYRQSSSKPG